jgi:hypothetical protein
MIPPGTVPMSWIVGRMVWRGYDTTRCAVLSTTCYNTEQFVLKNKISCEIRNIYCKTCTVGYCEPIFEYWRPSIVDQKQFQD